MGALAFDGGDSGLSEFLAVGICLILAVAWVGWLAGTYYELKKLDDLEGHRDAFRLD